VTSVTWLDWFVLINIILIVFAVAMSLVIIVLEESERPAIKACASPLDQAVRHTQPAGVLTINGIMLGMGLLDVDVDVSTIVTTAWAAVAVDIFTCFAVFTLNAWPAVRKARREMGVTVVIKSDEMVVTAVTRSDDSGGAPADPAPLYTPVSPPTSSDELTHAIASMVALMERWEQKLSNTGQQSHTAAVNTLRSAQAGQDVVDRKLAEAESQVVRARKPGEFYASEAVGQMWF